MSLALTSRLVPMREILQVLGASLTVLIFFTVARLLFYLINSESIAGSGFEVLAALRSGLRFDLATLAYGSALGLPALALGVGLSRYKPVRTTAIWILFAPHALALLVNMTDIAYFKYSYRRETNELFTMFSEVINAATSEALSNWWLVIVTMLLLATLFFVLRWSLRVFPNLIAWPDSVKSGNSLSLTWGGRIVFALALFGIGAIMARGGLQDRPLRPGMAFTSDSRPLGQLTLNSAYSIVWSRLHQQGQVLHLMNEDSARILTQQLIAGPTDRFLTESYPFLRGSTPAAPDKRIDPMNVVILIMESWNAQQTGAITGATLEASLTPMFDSLAKDGLLFTNFYSSGDRSIHAFPAIISSLPNLTGTGILHTELETKRFRGLGSILKEQGYKTIFAMGAEPSSMGFDSYAKAAGFVEHISRDTYRESHGSEDENQWGVFDEVFLGFVEERLAQVAEPFALTFFSLTAHSPFEVPRRFARLYPIENDTDVDGAASASVNEQRQERALRFADYSLGKFFESARQRDYFDRTIFVITGDHTGWERHTAQYTPLQLLQVPLLIYAPGVVNPGIDSLPANQVDILPTLLSVLGNDVISSALGQPLGANETHRISFSAKASSISFLYDSLVVRATSGNETEAGATSIYNYRTDPQLQSNLVLDTSYDLIAPEAISAFRAYLQTGMNALVRDKLFPPKADLDEILKTSEQ